MLGSLPGSAITPPLQVPGLEPLGVAVDPSVVLALAVPALARTTAAVRTVIHESLARTVHLVFTEDSRRNSTPLVRFYAIDGPGRN